jgi:hypothetical protein
MKKHCDSGESLQIRKIRKSAIKKSNFFENSKRIQKGFSRRIRGLGGLFDEKNWSSKISWHCPFNQLGRWWCTTVLLYAVRVNNYCLAFMYCIIITVLKNKAEESWRMNSDELKETWVNKDELEWRRMNLNEQGWISICPDEQGLASMTKDEHWTSNNKDE